MSWIRGRKVKLLIGVAVLALVAGAAGLWWRAGADKVRATAWFAAAVGVYAGSDVRMLGVRVGTIDVVEPQGQRVKVEFTLDSGVKAPAQAKLVSVAPSLVSDRYLQLAPTYSGGPTLADGAVIPVERTASPVELDQLYESMEKLATALGPNGANKNGALSGLLDTGAANLAGNGAALNKLFNDLGQAAKTLDGSQVDLFGTVDNLAKFTGMLARNDNQVVAAEQQLAEVTRFLAADRDALRAALAELPAALGQVGDFVRDNRGRIKSTVDKLTGITKVLADQRAALAEAVDVAPLAITNLLNAYNPATRTIDGRVNLNELAPKTKARLVPVTTGVDQKKLPVLPLPVVGDLHTLPTGGS
ncbi:MULTISPECIES: MCE family protein [unclassified Crossiella]|uniref:MCE family protein n=1 Tax=unclassified Crossiella TaxID=2620835 RepID=UPI001FFF5E5F|nr:MULTISPECIES: MCE family protein [unclassified Crossiella]MCK2239906.1 MCE family protein [Crossiella sp. S99.2]MCK2252614.1 MCE family protein [Crossiella sp. S99.1]